MEIIITINPEINKYLICLYTFWIISFFLNCDRICNNNNTLHEGVHGMSSVGFKN